MLPKRTAASSVSVHLRAEYGNPQLIQGPLRRDQMLFLHISGKTMDQDTKRTRLFAVYAVKLGMQRNSVAVDRKFGLLS